MGLTLTNIQSRVRLLTKEPYPTSPVFATDANVLALANDAQIELASRTQCKEATNIPNSISDPSDVTVANQRLYSMPTGIGDVYKVLVDGDIMVRANFDDLAKMGGTDWWKKTGRPTHYYFEDLSGTKKIGFWPTPGSVYYFVTMGNNIPTAMSAAGNYPDIDERLHNAVVFKVCQWVMASRREMQKADYWEKQYEGEVAKYMKSGMDSYEGKDFLSTPTPSD